MQPDDRRHFSRHAYTEMASHGFADHFAQFFDRVALCGDGMSKRSGDITTINLIFLNFKNDFAHKTILLGSANPRKLTTRV